jgi:hypothetical protein
MDRKGFDMDELKKIFSSFLTDISHQFSTAFWQEAVYFQFRELATPSNQFKITRTPPTHGLPGVRIAIWFSWTRYV